MEEETKISLTNILESQKSAAKRVRKDLMVSTRILGVAFLTLSLGLLTGFYEATDPIGVPTALLFFFIGVLLVFIGWKKEIKRRFSGVST
jgi:hypothetical protein